MCRLMVYKGHNSMLMADLLTHPTRSIITQSYASKERVQSNLNGDGFGVGWYLPSEDPVSAKEDPRVPCVFTSVTPAWNNLNLKRLARTVSSPLIFAHVRAAMPGMLVTEANCHPFQCGRFMFMHNGGIADFLKIYRKARECLRDDLFNFVQGTTDSEIIFALFLNQIADYMGDFGSDELVFKIVATIKKILQLQLEAGGTKQASLLNFAVTDGRTVIATRFVDKSEEAPATLYFSSGTKFECRSHGNHSDEYHMTKTEKRDSAVIITSEPLTDNPKDWVPVPRNHVVVITPDLTVKLFPINLNEVEYQPVELSQHTINLTQQLMRDNTPEHKFLNSIKEGLKRKHGETESLRNHENGHSKAIRKVYETADISEIESDSRECQQECHCIHKLQEHTDNVLAIAVKEDLIFSGSADGTIKVWDSNAYQLVDTLQGHTGSIFSLSISHDTLFSASADSSILVWNISKLPIALVTKVVSNVSSIFSLAVSNSHLFAGYQDASVKASDLSPFGDRNPRTMHGEAHHGYVYCLAVLQNTKGDVLLASGAGDGLIKIWDIKQFVLSETLAGHSRSVMCLGTDPETAERSMILYSGSRDGTIKVWELLEFGSASTKSVNRFQCTRTLTGHGADVVCLSVSKKKLFTGSADGTVKVWDRDQLICQRTISMGNNISNFSRMFPLCLVSVTDDKLLVGVGNTLQVWHCEVPSTPEHPNGNSHSVSDLAVVPNNQEAIIETLRHFVSLKSVSGDPLCRSDCWKAAKYMMHLFESVGAESRLINVDEHSEKNPIVLARLGSNRQHPTITIYGHYDVVPAAIEDGWDSDPFVLSGRDGYLYGRGVTDNKGPLVACIYAIKELQRESKDLGVNIVFVVEGEEERDSEGFKECINQHKKWFDGTQVTLIINTYWLGDVRPCLIYGLRGTIDLELELSGPKQDLHSGLDGGNIHEPFHELSFLLSQLADGSGNILIPGFYDKVRQIGVEENALLDSVEFDMKQYQEYYGIQALKANSVKDFLVRRWCKPSLSVIGVTSSSTKGNAISKSVVAKINIRTVPDQSSADISKLLTDFIHQKFTQLGSSNRCQVRIVHTGDPWLGDITNKYYKAASKSIEAVWKVQPMFVREGGTIPVTPFLEQSFQAPVIHFPMGQSSDRAHLQNERLRVENLIKGKDILKNFVKEVRVSAKK